MSDYSVSEFLAFFFEHADAGRELLQRAAEQVEALFPYRVCDSWLSPRGEIGLLNLCTGAHSGLATGSEPLGSVPSAPPANRLRVCERFAWLQAGYTTSAPERWESTLRASTGELRCDDAGGIAAFCVATFGGGRPEQLFLWSTRPGLRVIARAENARMLVAGTRPYMVHRIARDGACARPEHRYVLASLAGWSPSDLTPYEETSLLPVDDMLCIGSGGRALLDHPTPAYDRPPYGSLREHRPRYVSALREAVEPLRSLPGFELRLSGGKDSRLVAAALYDRGVEPSTVACHGHVAEWEAPTARRVAEALGWTLKSAVPEFAYRDSDIVETVRHNLGLSDGFFATEPVQSPYPQFGASGERGPGLVLGHIELQRGGWAMRMSGPRSKGLAVARKKLTPYRDCVVPALADAATRELDDFVATVDASSAPEYLYWLNYRFRVCRWLTSHYLALSKRLLPVYPLLDEKVVRVVSNTPLHLLVSEELVFATTCALAPQLRRVPLFMARYRFEAKVPSLRHLCGYRSRAPLQPAQGTSGYVKRELIRPGPVARVLCEHIRTGPLREELREATRPAIWRAIERPDKERLDACAVPQRVLSQYLWTCFQASVLFSDFG
jgi:hypothetical protein